MTEHEERRSYFIRQVFRGNPGLFLDIPTLDPLTFEEVEARFVSLRSAAREYKMDVQMTLFVRNDDGSANLMGYWNTVMPDSSLPPETTRQPQE